MNLILTMAGTYSRFKKEGYNIPKYLLPWKCHTILTEILLTMQGGRYTFENIFLVANERDYDFRGHILKTLDYFNIPKDHLFLIKDTSGQAETAMIALDRVNIKGPLSIHNIDTILYNRDYRFVERCLIKGGVGYIDLFISNNHEYSYVLLNNDNLVTEISEKILISKFATSGLYGFSSPEVYKRYYNKQIFISDVYRSMLSADENIIGGKIYTEQETKVLGTPTEYLNLSQCL